MKKLSRKNPKQITKRNPLGVIPAKKQLVDLIDWVMSYNGDIDHSAFIMACNRVLQTTLREIKKYSVKFVFLNKGLVTLELAIMLGDLKPSSAASSLATQFPKLPGARELNSDFDEHF